MSRSRGFLDIMYSTAFDIRTISSNSPLQPGSLAFNFIFCSALFAALCLIRWACKRLMSKRLDDQPSQIPSQTPSPSRISRKLSLDTIYPKTPLAKRTNESPISSPPTSPRAMRFSRRVRSNTKKILAIPTSAPPPPTTKQPYEVFLVLDVEATCQLGTDFTFPNEIIEFPVALMRWKDRVDGKASQLEVVDEFRSFVKPTWRPTLSQFCTDLTGITQAQVDSAPPFPEVLNSFHKFLIKHGLIDATTGERRVRFCWCSDGPFDVRDFVVKQCFISKVTMPEWIRGDVLDVRTMVMNWLSLQPIPIQTLEPPATRPWFGPKRRSLNIPSQLEALGLPGFEGRQHSGIDDTRNIAKILTELARKGVCLLPNTGIHPERRWPWMGKRGQILEEYC